MSDQIIPLTDAPIQSFAVQLAVDGGTLTLQLTVRYNEIAGCWVMTVSDASGNLLLDSVPMLTGAWPAANLLEQFSYLAIGSAYVLNVSGAETVTEELDWPQLEPGAQVWGKDFLLLWGDTAAI